jgi:hypothetical protein
MFCGTLELVLPVAIVPKRLVPPLAGFTPPKRLDEFVVPTGPG